MDEDALQDIRRLRLRAWVDNRGGATEAIAGRNVKPSYASFLSQVMGGYSFGPRAARTCESRLGMPTGWLDIQHAIEGAELRGPLAQDLIHPPPSIDPPELPWESILESDLKELFKVRVRDDAMAPQFKPGDFVYFDPTRAPVANKAVLLADRDGEVHIRTYSPRRGTQWAALAANPGYQPMDSVADGLRVLAAFRGHFEN